MVLRCVLLGVAFACACTGVPAQGIMSDLMNGKLINPEVGAYAWYSLKDTATGREFFLRQAIVGEERVKRKTAYWLETELVPRVGFPSVYKMLLTGPASDPKNVHRLLVREGDGMVQEVVLDDVERGGADEEVPRMPAGTETMTLPGGEIEAEHFTLGEGEDKTEIWISDKVAPMGLVKMQTGQGELMLQRYGVGGKDGQSAIPSAAPPGGDASVGLGEGDPEADGVEQERKEVEAAGEDRVRKNFGRRTGGRRP